ncbi:hypothetical protein PVIIG_06119 [Plasmodium vivax India VII]|uniref:VIR protein n=1 Tax=Plasmodium vivax India VII TaxID=1077284 RepID=A0A0J9S3M9_PLAVI|nr:hypothetical protein PVIIG_06119 [Plasmodium vivax India VII]
MTSNQEDPWYLEYNYYDEVKKQYNNAIKYDRYDEEELDTTIVYMNSQNHNLNKKDYIIKYLFRLLSNSPAFYVGMTPNYCKYINIWLNEKHRDDNYNKNMPNFDVLKKFVHKLTDEKYKNHKNSCENYIKFLDTEIYININFLHRLYDAYNNIKDLSQKKKKDPCGDLVFLARNYRETIDEHYENNTILYDKLDNIKGLILKITENDNSPCTSKIYFSTPKKLIELQEKEALKAQEEQLRKQNEEAQSKAREEQLIREKAEMEQLRETSRGRAEQLQLYQSNALQRMPLENVLSQSTDDSGGLRTSELSLFREHTEEQLSYQTEENILQREKGYAQKETSGTTGIFGGSTGFPGYITGVLGSVDPGPVLGVSGGMGALFLLFKVFKVLKL